jgi:hypothetical protein
MMDTSSLPTADAMSEMSKRNSRKKGSSIGDAHEDANPNGIILIKGVADIHRGLEKFAEENADLGKIVEEITITEFVVPDRVIPPINGPLNETEDEKHDRRKTVERNRDYNESLREKRDIAIVKLYKILPKKSVNWMKRHHQDVIDDSDLNRFCRLIPQAIIADDSMPLETRKEQVADLRKKNRSFKCYSKEKLDMHIEKTRECAAQCEAIGLPLTDAEILHDLMQKLGGNLAEIRTDFDNRHTEARVRGATLNNAALTTMRNNVIGKLPTDLTTFEAYVRNYAIRDTGGDILNYKHSSFVTMQEELKQLREEVKGKGKEKRVVSDDDYPDQEEMFATQHSGKRAKVKPSGGAKKIDTRICKGCNEQGHIMYWCPKQICKLCKSVGHCPNECPTLK